MNGVAECLPRAMFLDDVLDLIGKTEQRCYELLESKFGTDALRKASVKSNVFWELFVLGSSVGRLPAAIIVRASDHQFLSTPCRDGAERVAQFLSRVGDLWPAQLYLLLSLLAASHVPLYEAYIPALLRRCWDSGIYHLRLKILDCVSSWSGQVYDTGMSETTREEIKQILSTLEPSDAFVSTFLVETMMAYEMIESPIDAENVSEELREILAQPADVDAQQSAYAAVSNTFEDVYQDAYYDAIEALPRPDRIKLFTMAALAVPSYSLNGDYILRELGKYDDASTLVAFKRFATNLNGESSSPQEAAACFIHGQIGCARYVDVPVVLADLNNADRRAWQCYGEIFFWSNKPHLDAPAVEERCAPIWATLHGELAFEAVDPLMRFADCLLRILPSERGRDPVQQLFRRFQREIRAILEFGLKHRVRLSGIDKRHQADWAVRERTTFMIHTLGQIGTPDSIELLKPFVDDQYHGRDAVEAIRRLNSNQEFAGLTFLRRIP